MILANHSRRFIPALLAVALSLAIAISQANAGLIHRYSFKDATVKDSVGTVDGKLKGAAKIAEGKAVLENGAKTSDDANLSYIEFNSPVIPKSGSATLAIWITLKAGEPFPRILDIGDSQGGSGQAFIYLTPRHDDDVSKAAITSTDTGSKTFIDGKRLDDGKSHMAVIVIDGTAKKFHFFIDGKEQGDAADLGDNTLDKVTPSHSWIGRSGFDADPGLNGAIEEFRVYDQALSADEIAAAYKAGASALPVAGPTAAPK